MIIGPVRAIALLAAASFVLAGGSAAPAADTYRDARLRMVKECIESEGVSNRRVLDAMRQVPRHEFVPAALRRYAYEDMALPIGNSQTISPPFIVAYMTEIVDPQPGDRVLEIGTGSGFQAAVLSELVKEVYSIEIVEPLEQMAARRLKRLGYLNVTTKAGDGYKGWPEHAPFDKIIVTCSPEEVPQPLVDQLKEGGKMIIPLGQRYQQVFHLLEKRDGKLSETKLIPTLFVPMTGISEAERKIKPDPLHPAILNGGFEENKANEARPDGWHYQRQATLMSDSAPDGSKYLRMENSEPGHQAQVLQGLAVDGRAVRSLNVRLWVKYEQIVAGADADQKAKLTVHFYDAARKPVGDGSIGPWAGSSGWHEVESTISVPPNAREAILRIGLGGATGTLCIDGVRLSGQSKH